MIGVDLSKEEAQVINHALLLFAPVLSFRLPPIVVDV
jgi:hypothetical protein